MFSDFGLWPINSYVSHVCLEIAVVIYEKALWNWFKNPSNLTKKIWWCNITREFVELTIDVQKQLCCTCCCLLNFSKMWVIFSASKLSPGLLGGRNTQRKQEQASNLSNKSLADDIACLPNVCLVGNAVPEGTPSVYRGVYIINHNHNMLKARLLGQSLVLNH